MNDVTFEHLAKLPLVGSYERAFRKATGVPLRLVPAGLTATGLALAVHRDELARMGTTRRCGRRTRWETGGDEGRCPAGKALSPQTIRFVGGLQAVAVPVAVGGRPVGTWIAGPVFCRQPTQADFRSVVQQLAASGMSDEVSRIEAAFFGHPVVSADQFLAVRQLLVLFAGHVARHLSEEADRAWVVSRCGEPTYVTRAKDLVHAQITQRISLPQVAAAVHVHPGQLSREFRAATGVPFPEYVARLRVERAKALLADPSMRVSHVAYAAGFGSIPQFSAAFRHCLGKSPAQYRATQPQRPGV